jgi:Domain of unknown function (DUF5060)
MSNLIHFVALLLWWVSSKTYVSAQIINGFTLIKAPSTDLGPLPGTIDLSTVGSLLSIRADTNSNIVARVEFFFDGKKVRVEYIAPYALAGDTNGVYKPCVPMTVPGLHTLEAKVFDSTGTNLESRSTQFTVINQNPTSPVAEPIGVQAPVPTPIDVQAPVPAPIGVQAPVPAPSSSNSVITGYNLVAISNDVSNKYALPNIIDLATTGRSLSIEALTSTTANVASVSFAWDGDFVNLEASSPWALNGDVGSVFHVFTPMTILGSHTLVVKAMDMLNVVIETNTVSVTVVDSAIAPASAPTGISETVQVLGELRKWHKVTLAFTGPFASETDVINPFMQYRFDVTFTHDASGKIYNVPGFFAADGNAANTSASSGNKWYCHFAPDEIGNWTYVASFVEGPDISVSTDAGLPTSFHGQSGSFTIESSNKSGRDHRGKGRLMYVGQHHLKYAETGEWFLKAGADR